MSDVKRESFAGEGSPEDESGLGPVERVVVKSVEGLAQAGTEVMCHVPGTAEHALRKGADELQAEPEQLGRALYADGEQPPPVLQAPSAAPKAVSPTNS